MRFILVVLLAACLSCSNRSRLSTSVANQSPECKELVAFLKRSWKQGQDGYFYFTQKPKEYNKRYVSVTIENCLKGMSRKEIMKIFGNPSIENGNYIYYYMNEACASGKPPHNFSSECVLLIVHFNEYNQVIGVPAIKRFQGPIP